MVDLETVRSLLTYNAKTGVFRWRVARGGGVKPGDIAGSVKKDGYRYISVNGTHWKAARLAWLLHYKVPPPRLIDHKNRKRGDDRIRNLRAATVPLNAANSARHKDGSSGVKGVFWEKRIGKWRAVIFRNGKKEHLGCFTSIRKAGAAYRKRARELDGQFVARGA